MSSVRQLLMSIKIKVNKISTFKNSKGTRPQRIFNIVKKPKWTRLEDELLLSEVNLCGRNNWKIICTNFKRKSPNNCYERFRQIKPFVKKGRWTKAEDETIEKCVDAYGPRWSIISRQLGNRTGKQIRERYVNRLDCNINKSPFTFSEDLLILKLQKTHGNDWRQIANFIGNRSPDNVKIRFNSAIKQNKKILLFIERRDFGISEGEQLAYL